MAWRAVKGQDERQKTAPLTALHATGHSIVDVGEKNMEGRHVGLDFYDLLIEVKSRYFANLTIPGAIIAGRNPEAGMRLRILFLGSLLMISTSVIAQTVCRQANGKVVERRERFTILRISLPSQPSSIAAIALVADSRRRTGAYVFTLSKIQREGPQRSTEMLPAAIQLASEGHSSILLERILTWPEIDVTVGQMKPQALCAEQWLSTHAATKADDWNFIGPSEDVPSFEESREAGDTTSMKFNWGLPLAGHGDPKDTENVLQRGIVESVAAFSRSHEEAVK